MPSNHPWAEATDAVVERQQVDPERGLTGTEAKKRLRQAGPNRLQQRRRASAWRILASQFANLMTALLAAAALLSFVLVDWVDGVAILAVVLINAAIGFATELRAVRSMEALYKLAEVTARVRRDGQAKRIAAAGMVPGDVGLIEGGEVIAADMRIVEASNLQVDESALTGESAPVAKSADAVAADAALAERTSMLYKGTAVTRGSGVGVVVATGRDTELGHISELVEETEEEGTPLERRLAKLAQRLIWLTLGLSIALAAIGVLAGKELLLMVETAVALAVASVPEGLPVVATIALARGMRRMAQRNALVNRLSAVETLGATGVICTDKTGTLTENRMTVSHYLLGDGGVQVRSGEDAGFCREERATSPDDDALLHEALQIGVLCNNAELQDDDGSGDPMEVALLAAGRIAGFDRDELENEFAREREEAFSTETRMMATFNRDDDGLRVAVKGAPEAVLDACTKVRAGGDTQPLDDDARRQWSEHNESLADDGLRVLALARKRASSTDDDPYADLTLVGLVGLLDPPREDVKPAIEACQQAGIRVVMVTGDQAATARNVARAVGIGATDEDGGRQGSELRDPEEMDEQERLRLLEAAVLARVSPEQKLHLVDLHQQAGRVVAMTGDGVNDAPALKKADIGVAMGRRGTQVAREAADMVLKDDAFATIVEAVRQGRFIFDNIRKFALYLLSCNLSEVLVIGAATVVNAPLPLLPLQILFLNLVTDVFPALALGVGPGDPAVMKAPPRPAHEPVLRRQEWIAVAGYGLLITVAVLGAFAAALLWLRLPVAEAVTISFLALALGQLWHVLNMRAPGASVVVNDVTRNRWVWAALLLCVGLVLAAVYVEPLATVLELHAPEAGGWLLALGASLVPLLAGQIVSRLGAGRPRGGVAEAESAARVPPKPDTASS